MGRRLRTSKEQSSGRLLTDIPGGKNANQLDQLFDLTNKASRDNVFVNIATPFTRMGWNYLDRFVATDPTLVEPCVSSSLATGTSSMGRKERR